MNGVLPLTALPTKHTYRVEHRAVSQRQLSLVFTRGLRLRRDTNIWNDNSLVNTRCLVDLTDERYIGILSRLDFQHHLSINTTAQCRPMNLFSSKKATHTSCQEDSKAQRRLQLHARNKKCLDQILATTYNMTETKHNKNPSLMNSGPERTT